MLILTFLLGLSNPLSAQRVKLQCPQCKGYGYLICGYCQGSAVVYTQVYDYFNEQFVYQQSTCPNCKGYAKFRCAKCGGSGTIIINSKQNKNKSRVSFTGTCASHNGNKCRFVKSNGSRCDCSGYSAGNWNACECTKCGHSAEKH